MAQILDYVLLVCGSLYWYYVGFGMFFFLNNAACWTSDNKFVLLLKVIFPFAMDKDVEKLDVDFQAILRNVLLLLLFTAHHSIFSRKAVKEVLPHFWKKRERMLFNISSIVLFNACFYFWKQVGGVIWCVQLLPNASLYGSLALVLLMFVTLSMYDQNELGGINQLFGTGKKKVDSMGMRRFVRHPSDACFLLIFWFTPCMTFDRVIWTVGFTIYTVVATRWEEADMLREFPVEYRKYKKKVKYRLIPFVY